MKVLHINSYFNGSIFYKNLYDKQIKDELDIDVFVPVTTSYKLNGSNLGKYTTVSLNHHKYDRFMFHVKHFKIYKDVVSKFKIHNYSLIHAHSLFSNGYIAMKIKQNYDIPYIVAVRNTDVNVFFKYMIHLRSLGVQILKEAEHIIFLSKSYRDNVIEKFIPTKLREELYTKTSIIPNGIDDFWFVNLNTQKNIPTKNDLKLLHVGVINKNKNLVTTLKAIEIIKQKGYNVKFTVVGRIEDKTVYNKIKNLFYVDYISPQPMEKLIEVYRNNDIFIMPSKTETFGLVYAEAMSQGLPILYSRGQGFDYQFEDGKVGFSVDCMDSNEIAMKVIAILENYRQISLSSSKLCNKFRWDIISNSYSKIYKKITKGY